MRDHHFIFSAIISALFSLGAIGGNAQSLSIMKITPQANANNLATNTSIEVSFNQAIDGATLNDQTVVVRGSQSGKLSGALSGGGSNTITFTPYNSYKLGEHISITITTTLAGESTQTLARGHTYSFTVVSGPPPTSPLTFTHRNVGVSSQVEDIKALDFDHDGDLDIITGNESFDESIIVFENDGDQRFCDQTIAEFRNAEMYDIDGDGDFDAFGSTGSFNTEINWFENDGSVPFTEQLISTEDPWTLAGGDLDSDGDIDLVAAVLIPNRVLWFANDGSGSFSGGIPVPSSFDGGSDSFFHIVDINSDGAMDILAFHVDDRNLVWYENNGSQVFTEHLIENTTNRQRLAYGDVDEDGDIDILSTSIDNGVATLTLYLNDGTESFTPTPITVTSANPLEDVKIVDVDGDLDLDIIAGGFWFENDGNQSFTQNLISEGLKYNGVDAYTSGISFADMDNDGDMDLLTLGLYYVSWQENGLFMDVVSTNPENGSSDHTTDGIISITFNQPVDASTMTGNNISVVSNYRGKIDGDFSGGGSATITFNPATDFFPGELISVSVNEKVLSLSGHSLVKNFGFSFTIQSKPTSQPVFVYNSVTTHSANASGVDVADMDGDGDLDLLSCSYTQLLWLENDGAGNFITIPITTTATPIGVFAADLNNDGAMDILVNADGFNNNLAYTNDGNQNFTESAFPLSGNLQDVTDIDNDGDADVLYLQNANPWLFWAINNCDGYDRSGQEVTRVESRAAEVGDLDNDGDNDFAASSSLGPGFYNNNGYSLFPHENIDATSVVDQELADLDGDGDLDVVFATNGTAVIWYKNRLNEGSNDFGSLQEIATNLDPQSILAIDIDGDSDADIAVASRNDSKVVWYENRLNEASQDFGPPNLLPQSVAGPILVKSGDMDGDGDLDLITISDDDEQLAWFANITACEPSITSQPSSASLCEGDSHTLSVVAAGDPPINYQWSLNGTEISGATDSELVLNSVSNNDAGNYRCLVSNSCNSVNSAIATIMIDNVQIQQQPTGQTAMSGDNITFTISATGTNLTYQWQKDQSDINGATSPTLTLNGVAAVDAGSYTCAVTGNCGTVASNEAELTIQAVVGLTSVQEADFTIYPNPTYDFFYVKEAITNYQVSIYSVSGQRLLNLHLDTQKEPVDVSQLQNGTYLLVIEHTNQTYRSQIFISR